MRVSSVTTSAPRSRSSDGSVEAAESPPAKAARTQGLSAVVPPHQRPASVRAMPRVHAVSAAPPSP
eukprot:3265920-Pleurochrysis_carterae.AAC.1